MKICVHVIGFIPSTWPIFPDNIQEVAVRLEKTRYGEKNAKLVNKEI